MEHQPLVSVVVITYNSARFLQETLDSIAAQTYRNIEVIIADDRSKDDTVQVAEAWLQHHPGRLPSVHIEQGTKNEGIAMNCNRGVAHARGSWLKLIAGDDILLPDCIADNVAFVSAHPELDVVFSRMNRVDEEGRFLDEYFFPAALFDLTPGQQRSYLLRANYLPAPTGFIRMEALRDCGGFDPAFPMMEDLPLWMKMLEKGRRLGGMNVLTVDYRIHGASVQVRKGRRQTVYSKTNRDFDRLVRFPAVRRTSRLLYATVMVDLVVKEVALIDWLRPIVHPVLWIWAHCSPYTLPRNKTSNP